MQSRRRALLLVIAALIAAFTALSIRSRLQETPAEQPQAVVSAKVLVAKRDLAPGTFVQPQDLDWGAAPQTQGDVAPENALLREGSVSLNDFKGAVVRRQLHAGEPVPQSALMKSGEGGFMSAVLEPGMRAVSIAVNATSGNAGFVSPGDRIDLIVTHHFKVRSTDTNSGGQQEDAIASETFIRNVRVVAVDQMLDNPENKAILAKTVTVEVTPRQAEQIAVAADLGKISLALRSLTKPDEKPAKAQSESEHVMTDLYGAQQPVATPENDFTSDADVSRMAGHSPLPRVQVIRGDQTQNLQFEQVTP